MTKVAIRIEDFRCVRFPLLKLKVKVGNFTVITNLNIKMTLKLFFSFIYIKFTQLQIIPKLYSSGKLLMK